MVTKSQKIRLGFFLTISFIFFLIILILLGGKKFLKKKDIYYITYQDLSVSGLEIGAAVKYRGIRIGRVEEIKINPENISEIIVSIEIKQGTPIVKSAKAVIQGGGLTGIRFIEITGGSNSDPRLDPGSSIQAGISSFDKMSGQAEIILLKTEKVLNNIEKITNTENQKKFTHLLTNMDLTFIEVKNLLKNNRLAIQGLFC